MDAMPIYCSPAGRPGSIGGPPHRPSFALLPTHNMLAPKHSRSSAEWEMTDVLLCTYSGRISTRRLPSAGLVVLLGLNILALTSISVYHPLYQQIGQLPEHTSHPLVLTSYLPVSQRHFLGIPWGKKRPPPPATCDYCLLHPEDSMCEYGR